MKLGALLRAPTAIVSATWAYTLLAAACALGLYGSDSTRALLSSFGALPPQCLALVACELARRAAPTPRGRRSWRLVQLAVLVDVLATFAWGVRALGGGGYYGSWIDPLFQLYYPLLAAALLLHFRAAGGSLRRVRVWLDAAALTLGLGTALWVLIFEPLGETAGVGTLLASAGYSAGNTLTVVTGALLFMQITDWRAERATLALLASVVCVLITDTAWVVQEVDGRYQLGAAVDIGYAVNAALIATAAVLGERRVRASRAAHEEGNVYAFVPVLAALLAIVLLFGDRVGLRGHGSIAWLAVVALAAALLVARQIVARREFLELHGRSVARHAQQRLTELVQQSADLVVIVGRDGRLSYVSPAASAVLGREPSALIDADAATMFGEAYAEILATYLGELRADAGRPADLEFEYRTPGDECRYLQVTGIDHRGNSVIAGLCLTIRDVTRQRHLERELRQIAYFDPLTRLANRRLFLDRVGGALERMDGVHRPAVMIIAIDRFKSINDGLGHAVGDQLLGACAGRIAQGTRAADTVARIAGDEFAVLLEDVAGPGPVRAAGEHLLAALREPFMLDGRELRITACVGIALGGDGVSAEELLRHADAALFRAKGLGLGQLVTFESPMAQAARRRLELQSEFAGALERGELVVFYQPVVDLETGELAGVEALSRWRHPRRGLVAPVEFIPLAEETGLIVPMTRWLLERACADIARLEAARPGRGLRLSVNVSGRHLECAEFATDVRRALEATGFDPTRLVLEVTESVLMGDSEELRCVLEGVRAQGIRLALDDFGTGYASLASLHRWPFDVLKIDRSFVSRLDAGEGSERADTRAMLRAIVALARALGLLTIAEGIESEDQRRRLVGLGCRVGQGYLFGRPMAIEDLHEWRAARRPHLVAASSGHEATSAAAS